MPPREGRSRERDGAAGGSLSRMVRDRIKRSASKVDAVAVCHTEMGRRHESKLERLSFAMEGERRREKESPQFRDFTRGEWLPNAQSPKPICPNRKIPEAPPAATSIAPLRSTSSPAASRRFSLSLPRIPSELGLSLSSSHTLGARTPSRVLASHSLSLPRRLAVLAASVHCFWLLLLLPHRPRCFCPLLLAAAASATVPPLLLLPPRPRSASSGCCCFFHLGRVLLPRAAAAGLLFFKYPKTRTEPCLMEDGNPSSSNSTSSGGTTMEECQRMIQRTLKCSTVRFLREHLERAGCPVGDNFFKAVNCEQEVAGGYTQGVGIVVCSNRIEYEDEVKQVLVHELIHAFDECRAANLEWTNCAHHACSEIRAGHLSGDCHYKRELLRGFLKIRGHEQECIRRRVMKSLAENPFCSEKAAKDSLEAVWDVCYNDTEPFDKAP